MKLKKLKRRKREPKAQLSHLRNYAIRDLYSVVVGNKQAELEYEGTAEEQWCKISEVKCI